MYADLRAAVSQLKRQPTFVIGATLSLAIGMSLATAVFSVIESALLRPLPMREPERLVHVAETIQGTDITFAFLPFPFIVAVRDAARSFDGVAIYAGDLASVGESGEARSYRAARVTPDFFDVLGVRALVGRTFDASHRRPGDRSVIISHSLWSTLLGQRADIVGHTLPIGGVPHTVVGVMPPGVDLPGGTRLWFPIDDQTIARETAAGEGSFSVYKIVGRLASGASFEQAHAELRVVHRRVFAQDAQRTRGTRVMLFGDYLTWNLRDQLRIWGAAAILIMILCAVNFATMSLARGMRRRAEIAVRVTLGASKLRVVRMLVAEATVVAALSGVVAVLLGWWLLTFSEMWFADGSIPVPANVGWPTMLFGVLATALVGFAFALAPAFELAKVDLRSALAGAFSTAMMRRGEMRGRRALVALQLSLALSAVAVVTALLKADRRFQMYDVGFNPAPLVLANVAPVDTSVRGPSGEMLLERVRGMAGVQAVGAIRGMENMIAWGEKRLQNGIRSVVKDVSPGYFRTLDVSLIAGRLPTHEEIATRASVVVVSRVVAHLGFGGVDSAAGRQLRIKPPGDPARWVTVIGVLPDFGGGSLGLLGATIYTVGQRPLEPTSTLVARVAGSPPVFANEMGKGLAEFGAGLRVSDVRAAQTVIDRDRRATRGRTVFLACVAGLATLLAMVGVYGLTSYTTELRARELAIRTALGARAPQLAKAVVSELWWMALIGVCAAMLVSGRVTVFLDALYRNPMMRGPLITFSPLPTLVVGMVLLIIMAIATWVPLRRVLRLDVVRTIQSG